MYTVWCLVKSCKLHPELNECSISELRHFGCRIFDIRLCGRSNRKNPIRRRVLRMSNIRHSTEGWSNVENSTSEEGRFGCRIFDIRSYRMHTSNQRPFSSSLTFTKFWKLWTQICRNWTKLFIWTCYSSQASHALKAHNFSNRSNKLHLLESPNFIALIK